MKLDLLKTLLQFRNPDGGMPYAPGMPSFSEATLLTILAFIAAEETSQAQTLVEWALKNTNENGSIGLNREFPDEGLWNTPLLAIAAHHLRLMDERDSAIDFILGFRSIGRSQSPDNDLDARLVGWPWVANTFGWVEPTSWALIALKFAGKADHPRAIEGRRLLKDRSLPRGGWNYGNKKVFNNTLMPFEETTALALLALDEDDSDIAGRSLDLLETSLDQLHSLSSKALACLCLDRFGREMKEIQSAIEAMLANIDGNAMNLAHFAMGVIALAPRKVLTP
jgi:hypothetical protein